MIPTKVQGLDSGPSILEAIKRAANIDLDVLIIARGGGSLRRGRTRHTALASSEAGPFSFDRHDSEKPRRFDL